jgi:hypothetical protein
MLCFICLFFANFQFIYKICRRFRPCCCPVISRYRCSAADYLAYVLLIYRIVWQHQAKMPDINSQCFFSQFYAFSCQRLNFSVKLIHIIICPPKPKVPEVIRLGNIRHSHLFLRTFPYLPFTMSKSSLCILPFVATILG